MPVVNKKFKYYEKNWRLLGAERRLCRGICDSEASVTSPQQHGQSLAHGELEHSQKLTARAKPVWYVQFICQGSLGGTPWDGLIIREMFLETQGSGLPSRLTFYGWCSLPGELFGLGSFCSSFNSQDKTVGTSGVCPANATAVTADGPGEPDLKSLIGFTLWHRFAFTSWQHVGPCL